MRKSWNYSWRVYPRTQGTTGGGSRVRSAAAGAGDAGDAAGDATSAYGGTPRIIQVMDDHDLVCETHGRMDPTYNPKYWFWGK